MLKTSQDASKRRGFTMIEMLATIAIIGLLASMILPAVIGGKERARRVLCQNKMRQFYISAVMYAGDHNEVLPSAIPDDFVEKLAWISSATWTNLNAYGGSPTFMDCPNFPSPYNETGGVYQPGYGFSIGYHYMAGFNAWADWNSPQKLTDDPSLLLLTDPNQWSPSFSWSQYAHANNGPRLYGGVFNTKGAAVRPKEAGVSGSNRTRMNGAVDWIPVGRMQEHIASSLGTFYMAAW